MAIDTKTLHGVDDLLAKLKSLPPELVSKRGGPVAAGLRKGARVILKEAQRNILAVTRDSIAAGYVPTKVLHDALSIRRDPRPQRSGANEKMQVYVRRNKKYEGRITKKGGKPLTAIMTGRWLEFGTEHQRAEPWMLPAFMASRERALTTVVREIEAGANRIIRKMQKASR